MVDTAFFISDVIFCRRVIDKTITILKIRLEIFMDFSNFFNLSSEL